MLHARDGMLGALWLLAEFNSVMSKEIWNCTLHKNIS